MKDLIKQILEDEIENLDSQIEPSKTTVKIFVILKNSVKLKVRLHLVNSELLLRMQEKKDY